MDRSVRRAISIPVSVDVDLELLEEDAKLVLMDLLRLLSMDAQVRRKLDSWK